MDDGRCQTKLPHPFGVVGLVLHVGGAGRNDDRQPLCRNILKVLELDIDEHLLSLIGEQVDQRVYAEVNRNLVLTDGARADSVPNLEIETGEIAGAGHASATGRFDDEQLFYLRSRGIPEEAARRLVVRGFFNEIIAKIAVPAVRERLTEAIERELAITESRTS